MIEDDASLHRAVEESLRRAEALIDTGYSRGFVIQALQGAIDGLSIGEFTPLRP